MGECAMTDQKKNEIVELVKQAKTVYVSSVDENGYPNIKAMMTCRYDGLKTHYFSSNTSTKRVEQFKKNPKACIYYCNEDNFQGLMLMGSMEVCRDRHYREMLWQDGCEIYYPKGIDDEDYSVLKFTAVTGNYYHGLQNETFDVDSF
jgi:general stress protein 26